MKQISREVRSYFSAIKFRPDSTQFEKVTAALLLHLIDEEVCVEKELPTHFQPLTHFCDEYGFAKSTIYKFLKSIDNQDDVYRSHPLSKQIYVDTFKLLECLSLYHQAERTKNRAKQIIAFLKKVNEWRKEDDS